MKVVIKIASRTFIFILLTIITQIGGFIYLLSFTIARKWLWNSKFKFTIVFIGLYMLVTLMVVPLIAPFGGREKLKHSAQIKPANYLTVLLNRNYVRPELNNLLSATEKKLAGSNIEIHYLDANFPFINGFPLLPHLSHNDGKKIDICLIYETELGKVSNKQKSISGYGIFEDPRPNEYNQIEQCLKRGHFQYDFPKYLTFGSINKELKFSSKGTKTLIHNVLKNNQLGKLFIEPHLKNRLYLTHNKIRYHGCKAVRHDDHIHLQLK